jgi:dynein heavy chain
MARVQPVFKPLLKPHLEDMEKKVAPGMFILTWASMNIDGYLHRFKQVCGSSILHGLHGEARRK